MKSKNLSIRFVIQKNRINKKGECPIYCRLTYNSKRKEFSSGSFVTPKYWDSKRQNAKLFDGSEYLNVNLALLKKKLEDSYLKLRVNNANFSLSDVLREFKGETISTEKGVLEVFLLHNKRIEKLVGRDIKQVTYSKYLETGLHLKDFIKWKFKVKDIEFQDLKFTFLDEFDYYLKTEKNFQQSTINKAIQRFRKVVRYAIAEDYLDKDPFLLHKPQVIKKEVVFLTREELNNLEEYSFKNNRLEMHRDLFVFCCYSGLGYKEMANLKQEAIIDGFDGMPWLEVKREKTTRKYRVPILPKAMVIIEKYKMPERDNVFPITQNPTFNRFLKEIALIVGISKRLTHHIARKTFATTVLLYNDVPMEIVSKLLGHSKMQTTQEHYGQIIEGKVSEEMKKLSNKF